MHDSVKIDVFSKKIILLSVVLAAVAHVLFLWVLAKTNAPKIAPLPKPELISVEFVNLLESPEPPKPEPKPEPAPKPKIEPKPALTKPIEPKVKPKPAPKPPKAEAPKPVAPPPATPKTTEKVTPEKVEPPKPAPDTAAIQEQQILAAKAQAEAQMQIAREQAAREQAEAQRAAKLAAEKAAQEAEARAKAEAEAKAKAAAEAKARADAESKARADAEAAANKNSAGSGAPINISVTAASWRNKPNLHFDADEAMDFNPKNTTITATFSFNETGKISNVQITSTGDNRLDRQIKSRIARARLHPQIKDGTPRAGTATTTLQINL